MSYEPFDELMEKDLTPQEYIAELFERTDEEGVLYLPASHTHTGVLEPWPDYDYRCRMNWNLARYEAVLEKFNKVYAAIQEIGHIDEALWWDPEQAKEYLNDSELYRVWLTYLCGFDTPLFCDEKIMEIHDRLETVALAQQIAMHFADGKALEDCEREILERGLKTELSDEELDYYNEYHRLQEEQSEMRVGKNVYAYETVVFARRLCRLIELGAPEIIIHSEARRFAEMFVLHEYATEVKHASSAIREQKEKLEQMNEDELDEMDRERPQTNSAKSLLPLFVHQILGKHSSAKKHLHQQEIINYLKQPPYEIKVERKAISRTLYTLNNWFPGSVLCDKDGWWKE